MRTTFVNFANLYDQEEVNQTRFYPIGWQPIPIEIQAQNLSDGLPGFEPKWREDISNMLVPDTADGICILPTLVALGKYWNIDPYRAIGECIEPMYAAIAAKRPTVNYRRGQLSNQYVRLPEGWRNVVEPLEREAEHQGYNCLTLPFHFGDWKTGKCYSPRNATWQALSLSPARFPFCAVQVGASLLAMPDRLMPFDQLDIDCCDQYNWRSNGKWAYTLYVYLNGDKLSLVGNDAYHANVNSGLPVAFLET